MKQCDQTERLFQNYVPRSGLLHLVAIS